MDLNVGAQPNHVLPSPVAGWSPPDFADDDGSVHPELRQMLSTTHKRRWCRIVPGLSRHRLLVPLVEVPAQLLPTDEDCAGTGSAMVAVSVASPDGSPVGLAFTGLAALRRWNPAARPRPLHAVELAVSLVQQEAQELIIDPGSPECLRLPQVALWRLATRAPWPEPWADPWVVRALAEELAAEIADGALAIRARPPEGVDADLLVEIRLPRASAGIQQVTQADLPALASRLGGSAYLRRVFDGVLAVSGP
jgi:hypothetical protein